MRARDNKDMNREVEEERFFEMKSRDVQEKKKTKACIDTCRCFTLMTDIDGFA